MGGGQWGTAEGVLTVRRLVGKRSLKRGVRKSAMRGQMGTERRITKEAGLESAGSPRHDLGAFYAARPVSPQLLLTGTPKVSTFQVSKLGAVARALFCTAAGAEDGHVNPSSKTRFRPTTSRLRS